MPKKKGRDQLRLPSSRLARPPLLISAGLICCTIPAMKTQAQEALFSALSLDSVIQEQNNPLVEHPANLPHLGPVNLALGGYSSVTVDNNINLSQYSPESDTIIAAGSNLGFSWPATSQSTLQLNSLIGYNWYVEHSDNDYLQVSPGSALTYAVKLADWTVTFYDQLSYTRNVQAVASVSNVSGIPIVNNTVGFRTQWQPGIWLLQAGYSYNNYFSTSATYTYLNNASDNLFARAAWLFADGGQLGLETSGSFTYYDQSTQSNNKSFSFGPYLEWQADQFVHVSVHGGPTIYWFASNGSGQSNNNLNSYYLKFDLSHQLTSFLSQQLTLNESISPGLGAGSSYTKQFTLDYSLDWTLKSWLHAFGGFTYENGNQPYGVGVGSSTENFERYGANVGIRYQITQRWGGILSYNYLDRGSNISGNSYRDDNVSAKIQYTF